MKKRNQVTPVFGLILAWMFGIVFAIMGLVSIFSNFIVGLCFLLLAIILLPPFSHYLKSNLHLTKWLKCILILILLIIAVIAIPTTEKMDIKGRETKEETTLTETVGEGSVTGPIGEEGVEKEEDNTIYQIDIEEYECDMLDNTNNMFVLDGRNITKREACYMAEAVLKLSFWTCYRIKSENTEEYCKLLVGHFAANIVSELYRSVYAMKLKAKLFRDWRFCKEISCGDTWESTCYRFYHGEPYQNKKYIYDCIELVAKEISDVAICENIPQEDSYSNQSHSNCIEQFSED